jgi:hypothetical protein
MPWDGAENKMAIVAATKLPAKGIRFIVGGPPSSNSTMSVAGCNLLTKPSTVYRPDHKGLGI